MVNRLTDASPGEIRFEGQDIPAFRGAAMRVWQGPCARIFRQFNLVPRLDVVSNVRHGVLDGRSTLQTLFSLRTAADAGIVDMNDLVQTWKSNAIPEGAIVIRKNIPGRVKIDMTAMLAALPGTHKDCADAIQAGETQGFRPINDPAGDVIEQPGKRGAAHWS